MTRYGIPTTYGEPTTYGLTSTPSLNVYPFTATILTTNFAQLEFTIPVLSGGDPAHRFRILRNHDGIPDHYEDGTLLFETLDSVPTANLPGNRYVFTDDGSVSPLKPGHRVYYTIWIWQGAAGGDKWILAGYAESVVPDDSSESIDGRTIGTTHQKMMDLLPRVFTSKEQNAIDEVDYDSDLSLFLSSMSFTYDEIMTQAKLLMPEESFQHFTPQLLEAQGYTFRLPNRNRPSTKYARKLLRDALPMYAGKGTRASFSTFIENLTGYIPQISYSPNLFLSPQDATFFEGIGGWQATGDATIEESGDVLTPVGTGDATDTEITYASDTDYTGHVVISSAPTQIDNGVIDPITKGIPVVEGETYSWYFYLKSLEDTIGVTPIVHWYDYLGRIIGSYTGDEVTTTSTWTKQSLSVDDDPVFTAPPSAVYQWIDPADPVSGTSYEWVNQGTYESRNLFTVKGSYRNYDELDAAVTSPVKGDVYLTLGAVYAGITLEFDTVGELYLDMMQFAQSEFTDVREARAVGFTILPEKENLISNPSFETNTSGWTAVNATLTNPSITPSIPGTPSGAKMLTVASTNGDTVTVSVNSEELIVNQSQLVFSAHTLSTEDYEYDVELEIYSLEPYSNFIAEADSLPTSGTNWVGDDSDGTWAAANSGTGGPADTGGNNRVYTFSSAPTSGAVGAGIALAGITPVTTFGYDAEYSAKMWVKSSIDASFYPEITWEINDGDDDDIISTGDVAYLSANTWTQIEYITVSPTSVTGASFVIRSSAEENSWEIGDTIAFAGAAFGYLTTVSTRTWTQSPVWNRIYVHEFVPDMRIPSSVAGLSAQARISYVSTGTNVKIDAVQLEEGYTPSDYFDGNYALSGWRGTEHLSPSYHFYSRPEKLVQLYTEIRKHIPMGIPYFVEGPNGVEYEGKFKGYA